MAEKLSPLALLDALEERGTTLEFEEDLEPEEVDTGKWVEIPGGPELMRVLSLPRRPMPDHGSDEARELAAYFTERLSIRGWHLREIDGEQVRVEEPYPGNANPSQALGWQEAYESVAAGPERGAVFNFRVGAGKTLEAALLPTIVGVADPAAAERPLYLCPAANTGSVMLEFQKMRECWHMPEAWQYPIYSYELLAHPNHGEQRDEKDPSIVTRVSTLEMLAPTMLVLDEGHRCGNSQSVIARRIDAYLEKHPNTRVFWMTGTPFNKSIKDAEHCFWWCLREGSPLPHGKKVDVVLQTDEKGELTAFVERELWASHLDAKRGMLARAGAGELVKFLDDEELKEWQGCAEGSDAQRSVMRRAIARRILETPGIIGTQDPPLHTKLTVESRQVTDEDEELGEALAKLRKDWCLPDGTEFADGLEFARHMTTLSRGFWKRWDPDPGTEYRLARNEWAKWCRKYIKTNKRNLESEARVKAFVEKGALKKSHPEALELLNAWKEQVAEWRAQHPKMPEPPSVAVWVSDECIREVAGWLNEREAGLVWVEDICLGERLSEELQIPFYHSNGLDKRGIFIENQAGKGPAVASLKSNGTGRNLQRLWWENLWICSLGEQPLGRTHRHGQPSPIVRNWVYLGSAEHLKTFYGAKATKAKFAEDMTLSPQKLRYAETDMPSMEELGAAGNWASRWCIPEED